MRSKKLEPALALVGNGNISAAQGARAYAILSKQVKDTGILDRDYTFYASLVTIDILGFFISGVGVFMALNPWEVLFWSAALGFFVVRLGGVMHDTAHRAVFNSVKNNNILGQIAAGLITMGFSSWRFRHNTHHAHPNEIGTDEDIINYPFISFSKERVKKARGIFRFLMRYQVYFYHLILLLISFELRVFPAIYYIRQKKGKNAAEIVAYVLGLFVWFVLPFILFPLYKALIIVFAANAVIGFYTGNIFAPNHKGMPLLEKGVVNKKSFLETQIVTTRNIRGNPITDYFYMGLNYQIEHHLFPNCPRNKLAEITPYVKRLCRQMKLDFTETGIIESNKIIVRELQKASQAA